MERKKIILITCFVATLIIGILLDRTVTYTIYSIANNDLKESELHYWATKSELTDSVQAYINKVAPTSDLRASALLDVCEKYSFDVKFALAQGEIESHFGTKGLASKTNSVWNVGAFDKMTFSDILKKHKYSHPNESIEPYVKLIYENYMTSETEEGLMNKFVDHNGKRYASAKDYEERLRYRYKVITKTTKIDSLQQQLQYWSIRANR